MGHQVATPFTPDELQRALRGICDRLEDVVRRIPAKAPAGSPRDRDLREARSTRGGGGRSRAALLDQLAGDVIVVIGNLSLLVEGVADCFQIAALRDNQINLPSLSNAVRPALEMAGQIMWLIDREIDGETRARRYLIWRLHDLGSQRRMFREFRLEESSAEWQEAHQALDRIEGKLLHQASAAKFASKSKVERGRDIEPAALLTPKGKPEGMPPKTELVRRVVSRPSIYPLLGVSAHGARYGVFHGLSPVEGAQPKGEMVEARISGFGFPAEIAFGMACAAAMLSGRVIAGWNAVDASDLQDEGMRWVRRAGVT